MILEIIIFLLTTVVAYYTYLYKRIHGYFQERGVRYLPGVPIFGNMYRSVFLKCHFVEELDEVYKAFPDDKYVGFIDCTAPALIIRDPELIKNITVKDFDHFVNHNELFNEEMHPLLGGGLVFMKDEKWRNMRSTLGPAFTSSKMKHIMPSMVDVAHNVIEYLQEHLSEVVDVDNLMRRYTNDVIASTGFGLQVDSVRGKDSELFKIGSNIFNFDFKQRIIYFVIKTHFPTLAKKLGIRIFSEKIHKFFTDIVTNTMEYRKRAKVERPDIIQMLIETPKEWTVDELASQVFIFFVSGFETSASPLVLTTHELALNPKVQEQLYQEIIKHKDKQELHFENLNELKYLDCVVKETLRKWSPGIFMDRTCVKSYELPPPREGGQPYIVKPGDVVFNMMNCLHTDPKYFPEPLTFDPDRFSDENKHNIHPFTFTPFGAGPRVCMGTRFALMEVKVLLYHLILNFRITKCEKTSDPIRLQPHRLNVQAIGGTWVQFEKRE